LMATLLLMLPISKSGIRRWRWRRRQRQSL
jgi:hypothetical protein